MNPKNKKIKSSTGVSWFVFDETVIGLLILICGTFYYTYHTLSSVKKEQGISNTTITEAQTATISSNDISPFIDGVVQVVCLSDENKLTSGSGILWKFENDKYNILTNNHVISNAKKCAMSTNDTNNKNSGIFSVEINKSKNKKDTDVAILNIGKSLSNENKNISDYNYNLSSLRKCPSKSSVGSPVAIIGYPSYTKRETTTDIKGLGTVQTVYRATTNGIISSYDTSLLKPAGNLSNENYFISAKIDIGNSGGVALSKDENGLCMLGLPTWVTVGDFENQGLVQNINNIIQ